MSLPDPSGAIVSLDDIAEDAPSLVVFACNHCPYVRHVAPVLGAWASAWTAAGVVVVAVNSNDWDAYPSDAPDRMPRFARDNGWTFPYLVDHDQSVANAFGAVCTPDAFLFDGAKNLYYRGELDETRPRGGAVATAATLGEEISRLLRGEPARPGEWAPSVGCSIKWRTTPH